MKLINGVIQAIDYPVCRCVGA